MFSILIIIRNISLAVKTFLNNRIFSERNVTLMTGVMAGKNSALTSEEKITFKKLNK